MQRQLPLFRPRTDASFDNFAVTEINAAAVHALRKWLQEPIGGSFYLFGAAGSGRSHLLQAACRDHIAIYLPLDALQQEDPAAVCEGLERASIVCLDDIDSVLADLAWCEQLFHLFNRMQAAQRKLLVSARGAAGVIECALPDLRSRLSWSGSFRLHALDEAGLALALKMRARERGFELDDDVVAYILARHSRTMPALLGLLQALDIHSLAERKRITIPFARRFIDSTGTSGA